MNIRRVVRLDYYDCDHGTVDIPDDATIIRVSWRTDGGLEYRRQPAGVWVERTIGRYDQDTGRDVYRDELPPPSLQEGLA